ncbi:P6 [Barley yellow dwarf virus-kerII]|uniref:p6 n=1 Tax=Barley yellow dwarf virus-kerII TaxID=2169987 RepID=R9UHI0_9TOMB|nr:P6 [Barley yellow dwarf virus-kerII]AGN54064.1 P6 [Barley yellow dwarf virus-kerII]
MGGLEVIAVCMIAIVFLQAVGTIVNMCICVGAIAAA